MKNFNTWIRYATVGLFLVLSLGTTQARNTSDYSQAMRTRMKTKITYGCNISPGTTKNFCYFYSGCMVYMIVTNLPLKKFIKIAEQGARIGRVLQPLRSYQRYCAGKYRQILK